MADNLVTVKTFQFGPEAEAAKMHLQAHGIRSFLADAETVNMDWLLGNALGYVKLQVSSDQAESAAAILQRMPARESPPDDREETAEVATCLSCGGKLPSGQSVCPSCGWSYASAGDEVTDEENVDDSDDGESRNGNASAMGVLRSIKRPVIWIIVAPFLIVAALVILFALSWLASTVMR
jgi:hypothetical protein